MRLLKVRSEFLLANATGVEVFSRRLHKDIVFSVPYRKFTKSPQATGPENIGGERILWGALARKPVNSSPRITFEYNGKIRRRRFGRNVSQGQMADRQGFEPWRRSPAYTLSRRAPSTTRPPVRGGRLAGNGHVLQECKSTLVQFLRVARRRTAISTSPVAASGSWMRRSLAPKQAHRWRRRLQTSPPCPGQLPRAARWRWFQHHTAANRSVTRTERSPITPPLPRPRGG